ncbi:MAG: SMC-Scp complex subunit ScpB [Clostridia bacterium]|nr:SMC-Scp complex subunit ScpB [Clostridia bacterium]
MLKSIIEALLFSAGKGMTFEEIMSVFQENHSDGEVREALDELLTEYSGSKGIIIIQYNNKYEFQSNPQYGETIADVLTPIKEKELSKTLLESLAIIAYKQPVTRLEIEEIRGISSEYAVSMLMKYNLITIAGRKDTLGKPLLYATTDEFLRRFKLKDLKELPDYDELLEMIRNNFDKYYKASESLYRGATSEAEELAEAAASDSGEEDFELGEDEIPDFLIDEDIVVIE